MRYGPRSNKISTSNNCIHTAINKYLIFNFNGAQASLLCLFCNLSNGTLLELQQFLFMVIYAVGPINQQKTQETDIKLKID